MGNWIEVELYRANERYMELLMDMARHDATPMFSLVGDIREELVGLDPASKLRVAQRSYLLIDFRFKDEPWWQAARSGTDESPIEMWSSHFPRGAAVEVARRVLTLAWTAAGLRSSRLGSQSGLTSGVAEIVRAMTLEEMERIAERYVACMRPRWEERIAIWRRLLEAARKEDSQTLQSIDLHGAQLLAIELMSKGG